mgnify:CR=1 FL=1
MTETANIPPTLNEEEQINTTYPIYAPRPAFLEFILTFFTFTISTSFWLVARVREVNYQSKDKFTPWLWFFVPSFFLAQLFAIPKLFREMDLISKNNNIQSLGTWKWGLLLLLTVSTAYINISDKIELPQWTWFIALTIYSFCIATLQHRFNHNKKNLESSNQREIKYLYKAWEWLLLLIGIPLTLFVFYTLVLTPILTSSKEILKDTTLIYPEQPFQFTILDDGWSEVELGTHSDGTAEIELSGPLNNMHFIVFKHGLNNSLNSVSYWRQSTILEENSTNKCTQVREFHERTIDVTALVICEGKSLIDPSLYISKTIQTDQGVYEIFGYLSSTKITFYEHKSNFIATAKGFKTI